MVLFKRVQLGVLIPVGDDTTVKESKAVGIKTDSVTCEFEGILLH